MAAPFPSSSRMDAWSQRRGLQNMNLRSVFTNEQQRILERYYDNGMTNQSKACFQLILQCAQESKLDFSVVRTWVGNKRRKLASKVEQNGGMSHSFSSHGLTGGLLSNHSLAGGSLSNHGLAGGALLPAELAAARNIQNRVHLLPSSSSFPSFSSTSSSPSSSSPHSNRSNNNNNNDVILTGIYSLNSAPRPRPRPSAPLSQSDSELPANTSTTSLISRALQSRNSSTSSPHHSKLVSLTQNLPPLTSASGPLVYTAVRKGAVSLVEAGLSAGAGVVPHSWTRQYGAAQTPPGPLPHSPSLSTDLTPTPNLNFNHLPLRRLGSKLRPRLRTVTSYPAGLHPVRNKQGRQAQAESCVCPESPESHRPAPHPLDSSPNFSIAMETGYEEDEWQREEELANMAAQTHIHRERTPTSPSGAEVSVGRGRNTPPMTSSRPSALHGSYSVTAQTSPPRESSAQDRTQFSDGDLLN
ncbi:hypothetical protein F7725_009813 [Dissostichus mawsoni]|uniref:Homeobox domain-containing protein n=1 Tax=Dissostichus mawsoni TaxID=36200 RepID=A0A7J5XLS7_DISMA|nr:hypothetical protein F7725_009813 [Dissostichus mawsoni]